MKVVSINIKLERAMEKLLASYPSVLLERAANELMKHRQPPQHTGG
jgi:hypothetical protein